MMKGLFFRELYLGRKSYISITAIAFIMMLMGILIRLSMRIGNLAKLDPEAFAETDNVTSFLSVLTSVICFMLCFGSIDVAAIDFKSKWMPFQYSSPVKEEKLVLVKYLTLVFTAIAALIPSLINAAVIGELSDRPLSSETVSVIIVIMSAVLCFTTFGLTLTFLFRSFEKVLVAFLVLFFAAFFLFVPTIVKFADSDTTIEEITRKAVDYAPYAVLIAIAVLAAGYFICVKLLKRRMN